MEYALGNDKALNGGHSNTSGTQEKTNAVDDYEIVRRTIAFVSLSWREQPSLKTIATHVGMSPFALQKLFTRWAGISPKAFLQAITLRAAKQLLDDNASLLDAAYEVGMSGPSRLHDLFVTHEAMPPGVYKSKGVGLTIQYGYHPCPFGVAVVLMTDRGLAGLAFADAGGEDTALDDMMSRWPNAQYVHSQEATAPMAMRIFATRKWTPETPLRVVLIGTDFEIRVWQTLLKIPAGGLTSYGAIANHLGSPKAARAVGSAVGRNPLSFVVPCHRVVGASGAITGYHWGLTRKRAMLGWESGLGARSIAKCV